MSAQNGSPHDSDLTPEKVKAHLKKTRDSIPTPPDGCACPPGCASGEHKLDLEDSAELTPEKVKAFLRRQTAEAGEHAATASKIAKTPPSRRLEK